MLNVNFRAFWINSDHVSEGSENDLKYPGAERVGMFKLELDNDFYGCFFEVCSILSEKRMVET